MVLNGNGYFMQQVIFYGRKLFSVGLCPWVNDIQSCLFFAKVIKFGEPVVTGLPALPLKIRLKGMSAIETQYLLSYLIRCIGDAEKIQIFLGYIACFLKHGGF